MEMAHSVRWEKPIEDVDFQELKPLTVTVDLPGILYLIDTPW